MNEKSTYTEQEFLNLRKFEKSFLLTVLEETLVQKKDKITDLKEKLRMITETKDEYSGNLTKALAANDSLH